MPEFNVYELGDIRSVVKHGVEDYDVLGTIYLLFEANDSHGMAFYN